MSALAFVVTTAGAQPVDPTAIRASIETDVAAASPGYTADLPGSLIEDILSTGIAQIAVAGQAAVDAVNSLSVATAQPYILAVLGAQFGLPINQTTNGSADVVFSGTIGYVIPAGFVVGDASGNQYATVASSVVGASGESLPVSVIETSANQNQIPAGSITKIISALPSGITLTVINPLGGAPSTTQETVAQYRARLMNAFQSVVGGAPQTIRNALDAIPGITSNAVNVVAENGGWQIVVFGGDDYAIANAILSSIGDIQLLQGSGLAIIALSAASSMVITTNYPSNIAVGATLTITGATPSAYNVTTTVTAVSGTSITTGTNSAAFGAYTSGATFSPNPRNVSVTLTDAPDNYTILFVRATPHAVAVTVTYQTLLAAFTQQAQVSAIAQTALQSYITGLDVGQGISLIAMSNIMEAAIADVLPVAEISAIDYAITIDGVSVTPDAGTQIIQYDPEGIFSSASVTVAQAS